MDTLYLHCGYHKTGSSFLQTMFARNRDLLIKNSIYYPRSKDELEMLKGNISPGNGQQLLEVLNAGNRESVRLVLQQGIEEAVQNGSDSLFYSSEGLFHAFAKEEVLTLLCEASQQSEFSQIKALLYFRDPVSHALSTYKHRAKRGDHADFKRWISEKYETMGLIEKFVSYHTAHPIEWTCRKYQSDSSAMTKSAFGDWLNVEAPEIPGDDRVNTSLSLSEIRVLQMLKDQQGEAIDHLYKAFNSIPVSQKSRDSSLNRLYRFVAGSSLSHYKSLVQEINKLLPPKENLILEEVSDEVDFKPDATEITLSRTQVQSMGAAIEKAMESQKIKHRFLGLWKRIIEKMKRKMKASGF